MAKRSTNKASAPSPSAAATTKAAPQTMGDAALRYAREFGWRVFPLHLIDQSTGACSCDAGAHCPNIGKHPRVKSWQKNATTDEAQIEEWWKAWPSAGIGIATGKDSNLTVLDVDVRNGGDVTLSRLIVGNEMPEGVAIVETGGGGQHYYFSHTSAVNTSANKLGTGLDTRSDGGYVVGPPSLHVSGRRYQWSSEPKKSLPGWPAWLLPEHREATRGRPRKERFNPKAPAEVSALQHALQFIDPSDYDNWIRVGFILGRAFFWSDEGWKVYEEWAARSGAKYDAKKSRGLYYEDSRKSERSPEKSLTTATIYELAARNPDYSPFTAERQRQFTIYDDPSAEDKVLNETIAVLKAIPNCFQKDGMLTRVVTYDVAPDPSVDTGIERDNDAYVIRAHDSATLAVELTPYVSWRMMNGKEVRINRQTTADIVKWGTWPECRVLRTFAPHPTVRPDGTVIVEKGYDAPTGMFLVSNLNTPEISNNLSRKDAAAAAAAAIAPFNEFAFQNGSRAAFAACLWTIGVRHLFGTTPLFAFTAPRRGSGKTLLAEAANRFWYGTSLSKSGFTRDREEMEKRISSFLLAGDRMICFDNVPIGLTVDDPTLNLVLTSRRANFRILGRTERVQLSNESTWIVTGNNLRISGDIVRRTLIVYIDPETDRPEIRRFNVSNLEEHIVQNRGALIGAALSAFASFLKKGGGLDALDAKLQTSTTRGSNTWGGFDVWWRIMSEFLDWVGIEGLESAREESVEEDEEGAYDREFVEAMETHLFMGEDRWATTSETVQKIRNVQEFRAIFNSTFSASVQDPSAIGVIEPNLRTVGMLLHRLRNNIFNLSKDNEPPHHVKLVKSKETTASKWRLIQATK